MTEKYNPDTKFAFMTRAIAESSFSIPVPQGTLGTWIVLAKVCGSADDAIDKTEDPDRRQHITDGLIGYIEGSSDKIPSDDPDLINLMPQLRSIYQTLSQQSQASLIRTLKIFGRVTERARYETDITQYSKWKMLEGQINMQLFHDTASESMRLHPNFPQYSKTINKASRARNNIDALIDLNYDFGHGTTLIRPTLFNKAYLFKDAVVQMVKGIKCLNKDVVRKMFDIRISSR